MSLATDNANLEGRATVAPVEDEATGLLARWRSLPTWLRWMVFAAIASFVLAAVQTFGTGETDRLTAATASQTMLRWCVPILLAGLGGLFAERAGVVNIGLEGMMILGTWFGAWGAFNWGPWWGLVAGLVGGALGGLLHAIATVGFGVDHIISGVAINILAPGMTRYLAGEVFDDYEGGSITQSPLVEDVGDFTMPVLAGGDIGSWESPDVLGSIMNRDWFFVSDFAGLTRGLMTQLSWFTIIALLLVPLTAYIIWRTRFGLRLRISGEEPSAGESLGVNIYRHKYAGVIISGALAGMAGAFIVIELTGIYREGQTNGRGFIGMAALIFGNWRPGGILGGAMLFAYPLGISLRDISEESAATHALLLVVAIVLFAVMVWSIVRGKKIDAVISGVLAAATAFWYFATDSVPTWLPNNMPYVFVLLVLIFNSQRLRMPRALGLPYRRGGQ